MLLASICCTGTRSAVTSSRLKNLSSSSASTTLQYKEKSPVQLHAGLEWGSTYLPKVTLKIGHQCWVVSSRKKPIQISSAWVRRRCGAPWGGPRAPHPQLLAMGFPSQGWLRLLGWCFASGRLRWKMTEDSRSSAESRSEGSTKALPI